MIFIDDFVQTVPGSDEEIVARENTQDIFCVVAVS